MTGCDWCKTSFPARTGNHTFNDPAGRVWVLCMHCKSAARSGDYSTAPAVIVGE